MVVRALRIGLLLIAAAVLAGCAGQAAPTPVRTNHVEMPPSYQFSPAVIEVTAGTTVVWHNSDNFTHGVSFLNGQFPFLNLKPGESGQITFAQPGQYSYVCPYHSQNMKGEVIVTSS